MFQIQKLFWPVVLGALLWGVHYVGAEEDNSRAVKIIDGPSTPPAPLAPPSADVPVSPANSSNSSIEPDQDRPASSPVIVSPSTPAEPPITSANLDPQTAIKIANPAELSLEMLPGQSVSIGSQVTFLIKSKKAGYVVLIDVDANGKLTQIFPNVASLSRNPRPNANHIKPGAPLLVPNLAAAEGVAYVVSPPAGKAMVVAMWSEIPVQMLDLPDVPPEIARQDATLNYLTKWANELTIPESTTSRLHQARWSLDAKPYSIQ